MTKLEFPPEPYILFRIGKLPYMSCPVFQRRPSTHYMCAQEVHTYNNRIEISKQCLYKVGNILY
jgi:hypothetical protein